MSTPDVPHVGQSRKQARKVRIQRFAEDMAKLRAFGPRGKAVKRRKER